MTQTYQGSTTNRAHADLDALWARLGAAVAQATPIATQDLSLDDKVLAQNVQVSPAVDGSVTFAQIQALITPYPVLQWEIGVTKPQYPYGDPIRYGAQGTGDDSIYVQNAISSVEAIRAATFVNYPVLLNRLYSCHGLVSNGIGTTIRGTGRRWSGLVKNANGPVITFSGDDIRCEEFLVYGAGFTGDNVVATGDRPYFWIDSNRAAGRALKATGGEVKFYGHFQTDDATATGFDVELGKSGTATLYHKGTYWSQQATGGLLMTDCGAPNISGGQFGKLSHKRGTGPAGWGSAQIVGVRILGNVVVEGPNTTFTSNIFDAISFQFAAGTSGCSCDWSNAWANGSTRTNLGNSNNLIVRVTSLGGTFTWLIGDDTSLASFSVDLLTGVFTVPWNVVLPSQAALKLTGPTGVASLNMTAADNLAITNPVSGKAMQFTVTGAAIIQLLQGATQRQAMASDGTWGQSSHLVRPTYGANVVIDCSLGNTFEIVVTDGNPFTINNPTNVPFTGDRIVIRVKNTSGVPIGGVSWGGAYRQSVALTPADTKNQSVEFEYDGTNWIQSRAQMADVPN